MEYCPTDTILGYYFTKPLLVALFIKFSDLIMNSSSDLALHIMQDHRSMLRRDGFETTNVCDVAKKSMPDLPTEIVGLVLYLLHTY